MLKSAAFFRFLTVLLICLTASYAIVYTAIQNFSEADPGGNYDALLYLSIYRGQEAPVKYWSSRIVTPFLARILPDPPGWLFSPQRELSEPWIAKIKFGTVNFIFLTLTGILLFYFLLSFEFSPAESLLGVLLFYSMRPVVQYAGTPMAEAVGYFFLLLCFYAIRKNNLILLAIGFLPGVFIKEAAFLSFGAVLLFERRFWRSRFALRALFLLIACSLVFYATRLYIFHIPLGERHFSLLTTNNLKNVLMGVFSFNKAADLLSSFGLLWILFAYGLIRGRPAELMRRWSYLVVVLLAVIFLLQLNLGRLLFFVFPVVIPLVLYGIRGIAEVDR